MLGKSFAEIQLSRSNWRLSPKHESLKTFPKRVEQILAWPNIEIFTSNQGQNLDACG